MTTTTVPSRTDPRVTYTVTRHPSGEYTCDCAGFQFRRVCWHCATVELCDELDRPQPARISAAGRAMQHQLDV